MSQDARPVIGLLFGDCTGIGPEIAAKVLARGADRPDARLVAIGDARVLEQGIADAGLDLTWRRVDEERMSWANNSVPLIDLGNVEPKTLARGQVSSLSGKLTGDTLAHAIGMARRGV